MDGVIQEFVNLKLSTDLSSVEMIGILSQNHPSQVKIQSRVDNNSSFLPCSTTVQLGNENRFVENDYIQKTATSKACSDACDWLIMEAAKEDLPPQMNKGYFQTDNVPKRSRSRANRVAQLPFEPQEMSQDENLNAIVASFEARGHVVTIRTDRFEDTFYSSFLVGDTEFIAESKKSKSDAKLLAAQKALKHFSNSDKPKTNGFFNDNDNGFILNGLCDSEADCTSTVCSVSRDDSTSINEPKLSSHDLKWIDLINRFNSVYDPTKSSISNFETIYSKDPTIFKIITKFDYTLQTFVTSVRNENLGTFTGEDSSQATSESAAKVTLFEELRKIAGLFSTFRTIYPSGIESCLGQMKLFLPMKRELISVQVWSKPGKLYQASIILSKMKDFTAVANSPEEAQKDAYIQMIKYIQLLSEHIKEAKYVSYDRSQPYGKKGGTFPGNRQGYQRPQGPKVPEITSSMCNNFVDLVADFNQIYDPRNVEESMDKLMEKNRELFERSRSKTRDRNGDKQYETLIKFISAIFNGVAASKTDSKKKAIIAIRDRLLRLSEMFEYFRRVYYSKIDLHPFRVNLFTHHGDVLKLKTRQSGTGFKTIISLIHFSDFHGESENSKEAEEIAFKKFVDYMVVLIERLPKTKHETEMEQKQISIRNQNGAAINVKNNQEFSLEDTIPSKVTPNSNEFVNRISERPVSNPKVDEKLSRLAKLVNNYNKGVTKGTCPENAVQKLSKMNSLVNSKTTQDSPNVFITTVDFSGIGSFFSTQDSQQESEHEASSKAMKFVQCLNSLWIKFENVSTYSPVEIMEHLMMNDIIKWDTSVLRKDKSNRLPLYHSILILTNICSFDRIADTEKDAKKAVAEECVAFLFKLAQAIHNSN